MSAWIVYSKDGLTERCVLRSLEYGGTHMGERAVTATFDSASEVAFEVFDYIEYRGEKFELEAVPTVKKTSDFNYEYELRFVSLKYELERCEMRDLVPYDNEVVYPTPLTFSFTGNVRYLTERIQACLDALYGSGTWNIIIADGVESEEKNITIAQQNCWNALALVSTAYGLNFYVKGRTITIGGEQSLVNHTFEYGKGNGLYEIERAADTGTGIVTKLRAYGSSRNLDYSYPKRPEWGDSVLPVSFAFSPLRLMLPSFKTDGKTDFVLADEATIAKYGIREASMVYDDIYPTITGATYNGQAIDEIKAVDEVDESKNYFTIYLYDLGFDLEEHLTTSDAQISMKTGALQGYTFTISVIDKLSDGYKLTLGRNSLENSEESGAYVPSKNWNMAKGDKFVLLNILMPQAYIREAENRLLDRAKEYLAQYGKTNFSYNIGLHDKFLVEHPSVYDALVEGSRLSVFDEELGISEDVTIQSITITENMEENILPQVKVTLNNEPSASTLDRIQGKLNDVASEVAANGFTAQSEIMAQYRKKLDKPFFEKLFVAIDKNGNEIAANDVTTPVAYILAKYDFASVGGVTMYAEGGDLDISSIYDGLPVDCQTIYWENVKDADGNVIGRVLKAAGGGGTIDGITIEQLEAYLGVNKYATQSWVYSLGYASSSDLNALQTKVNDFLEGGDTDAIINKWKELEVFLSGLSESDNLATILGTKWTTDNDLISQWNTAYGWGDHSKVGYALKSYVDDTFVTLATKQDITGEKNFKGGLKVNGSPIVYDSTNKYWKLEGDLLVTGGVTMFASDSAFTPSTIMDGVVVDNTTIRKNPTSGALEFIGSINGGVASSVDWDNVDNKPSWIGSSKPSYSYSEISGTPTLLSSFTNDLGFIDSSALVDYLPTSSYTASDILVKLKTVDGAGSGLDADLLDGLQPSALSVLSASKLTTARTIWGQSFNGEDNVYGDLVVYGTSKNNTNAAAGKLWFNGIPSAGYGNGVYITGIHHASYGRKRLGIFQSNDESYYPTWKEVFTILPDGNVGIGTTSPSYKLHVEGTMYGDLKMKTPRTIWGQSFNGTGNVSGDMTGVRYIYDTYNSLIYNSSETWEAFGSGQKISILQGNKLQFKIVSDTKMTLSPSGNLLLGTTDDSYKLSVGGTGCFSSNPSDNILLRLNNTSTTSSVVTMDLRINGVRKSSIGYNGEHTYLINRTSGHYIGLYDNGNAVFDQGNVGIGTTNPTQKLHIEGNIKLGDIYSSNQTFNVFANSKEILSYSTELKYLSLGYGTLKDSFTTYLHGYKINLRYGTNGTDGLVLNSSGNVGIGTTSPSAKLHVSGNTISNEFVGPTPSGGQYPRYRLISDANSNSTWLQSANYAGTSTAGNITLSGMYGANLSLCKVLGSLLTTGGITMYSDQRKKTILRDVELSLKQIADAPLIEHYYNSDQDKTTHVGSIAQYWAELNNWFCKLDGEGYYTMEIQNAALASAISIARELQRYESKTDKKIRLLKKRIGELEDEIEKFKMA